VSPEIVINWFSFSFDRCRIFTVQVSGIIVIGSGLFFLRGSIEKLLAPLLGLQLLLGACLNPPLIDIACLS